MAFTPITLMEGTQLLNSQQTVYTSPTQTRTLITKCTVFNAGGVSVLFTMWIVAKGGGSGTAANQLMLESIPSDTTIEVYAAEGHTLETGDFIQVQAGAASSLSMRMSGAQIT